MAQQNVGWTHRALLLAGGCQGLLVGCWNRLLTLKATWLSLLAALGSTA